MGTTSERDLPAEGVVWEDQYRPCLNPRYPYCRADSRPSSRVGTELTIYGRCYAPYSSTRCLLDSDCQESDECADVTPGSDGRPAISGTCKPTTYSSQSEYTVTGGGYQTPILSLPQSYDVSEMGELCASICCQTPDCNFMQIDTQRYTCAFFRTCAYEPVNASYGVQVYGYTDFPAPPPSPTPPDPPQPPPSPPPQPPMMPCMPLAFAYVAPLRVASFKQSVALSKEHDVDCGQLTSDLQMGDVLNYVDFFYSYRTTVPSGPLFGATGLDIAKPDPNIVLRGLCAYEKVVSFDELDVDTRSSEFFMPTAIAQTPAFAYLRVKNAFYGQYGEDPGLKWGYNRQYGSCAAGDQLRRVKLGLSPNMNQSASRSQCISACSMYGTTVWLQRFAGEYDGSTSPVEYWYAQHSFLATMAPPVEEGVIADGCPAKLSVGADETPNSWTAPTCECFVGCGATNEAWNRNVFTEGNRSADLHTAKTRQTPGNRKDQAWLSSVFEIANGKIDTSTLPSNDRIIQKRSDVLRHDNTFRDVGDYSTPYEDEPIAGQHLVSLSARNRVTRTGFSGFDDARDMCEQMGGTIATDFGVDDFIRAKSASKNQLSHSAIDSASVRFYIGAKRPTTTSSTWYWTNDDDLVENRRISGSILTQFSTSSDTTALCSAYSVSSTSIEPVACFNASYHMGVLCENTRLVSGRRAMLLLSSKPEEINLRRRMFAEHTSILSDVAEKVLGFFVDDVSNDDGGRRLTDGSLLATLPVYKSDTFVPVRIVPTDPADSSKFLLDGRMDDEMVHILSASTKSSLLAPSLRADLQKRNFAQCGSSPFARTMLTVTHATCNATSQEDYEHARATALVHWSHAAYRPLYGMSNRVPPLDCCAICDESRRGDAQYTPSAVGSCTEWFAKHRAKREAFQHSTLKEQAQSDEPSQEQEKLSKEVQDWYKEVERSFGEYMDRACCAVPVQFKHHPNVSAYEHCHRSHCTTLLNRESMIHASQVLRSRLRGAPKRPVTATSDYVDPSLVSKEHKEHTRQITRARRLDARQRLPEHQRRLLVQDEVIEDDDLVFQYQLTPAQQVGIDLIADHNHPIEGCAYLISGPTRHDAPELKMSKAECALRGIVHRVAEAHDLSPDQIQRTLDTFGSSAMNKMQTLMNFFADPDDAPDPATETYETSRENVRLQDAKAEGALHRDFLRHHHRHGSNTNHQGGRRLSSAQLQHDEKEMLNEIDHLLQPQHMTRAVSVSAHADASMAATKDSITALHESVTWGRSVEQYAQRLDSSAQKASWNNLRAQARSGTLQERIATQESAIESNGYMATMRTTLTTAIGYTGSQTGSTLSLLSSTGSVITQTSSRARRIQDLFYQDASTDETSESDKGDVGGPRRLLETDVGDGTHMDLAELQSLRQHAKDRTRAIGRHLRRLHDKAHDNERVSTAWTPPSGALADLLLSIPWHETLPTLQSMAHADAAHMEWWSSGAKGEPPVHRSAWHKLFGSHIPPTALGRALRRKGYHIIEGKEPPWELTPSLTTSTSDHLHERHEKDDRATWSVFDGRKRTGTTRRLVERSLLGEGLIAAPGAFAGVAPTGGALMVPGDAPQNTDHAVSGTKVRTANAFEGLIAYLSYNVFLCYFYKPGTHDSPSGNLRNGQRIQTHRTPHMCFPAIPFGLPELNNFSTMTGIDPREQQFLAKRDGIDVYSNWCHSDMMRTMKSLSDSINYYIGFPSDSVPGLAVRRVVENPTAAYIAINNLERAFAANESSSRLTNTACAITRLDAIIWMAAFFFLLLATYTLCCWPCMLFCSTFLDNFFCGLYICFDGSAMLIFI